MFLNPLPTLLYTTLSIGHPTWVSTHTYTKPTSLTRNASACGETPRHHATQLHALQPVFYAMISLFPPLSPPYSMLPTPPSSPGWTEPPPIVNPQQPRDVLMRALLLVTSCHPMGVAYATISRRVSSHFPAAISRAPSCSHPIQHRVAVSPSIRNLAHPTNILLCCP
ncbi:hypothetical protein F4809DRAFT_245887 [Biscogniauxia mediterranea]|nr:hypothetical protein F4809DRAFT_245887 [Biscogniauxia mediterranea]